MIMMFLQVIVFLIIRYVEERRIGIVDGNHASFHGKSCLGNSKAISLLRSPSRLPFHSRWVAQYNISL